MTKSDIKKLSYNQALQELESILKNLQSSTPDIDSLAKETERASLLLNHCRSKLLRTEEELRKVLGEE